MIYYYLIVDNSDWRVLGKITFSSPSNYTEEQGYYQVTEDIYNQAVVDEMIYNPTTQTLSPLPFHYNKVATTTQINYPTEDSDLCLQDWMNGVDAALTGGAVAGSYTGNGDASRTIALDFTPSAVLVLRNDSVLADTSNIIGGLATASSPVQTSAGASAIAIVENGFTVGRGTGYTTNVSTKVYNYIAFR